MRRRNGLLLSLIFSSGALCATAADTRIPTVVVTADQHPHTAISGTLPTLISKAQFTHTGVATLADALREIGGLQLQETSNGGQAALSMRGFGVNASSNTLVMVNGIPLSNPDLAPPDINTIPLDQVALIEVIAGSESVLYGDQAVGGIVNIMTEPVTGNSVTGTCSAGSFNTYDCSGTLTHTRQQWTINQFLENKRSDNYREHNQFHLTQWLGHIAHQQHGALLRFDYQVAKESLQYPGGLSAEQVHANRRQANNDRDYFNDWHGQWHAKLQQAVAERWQLSMDLSHREMHGHGVLYADFEQSRQINILVSQLRMKWMDGQLLMGMDTDTDRYHLQSKYGKTSDRQEKYSVFALLNQSLDARTILSAGMRGALQHAYLLEFGDNNLRNSAFASTLGIVHHYRPYLSVYIRRAESYRFPKADENASTPPATPGLRTQRGVSLESGGEWHRAGSYAKLGVYQLKLRDEITFDPQQTPTAPFGTNRNLSPTTRWGGSLALKQTLTADTIFSMQYNYVNARFQNGPNAQKRIPLVAENILRASITQRLNDHFNLYVEGIVTGSQYGANDDANIAGKFGGYTVYNANLSYDTEHLHLALRLNNVSNKYYYFYTVYQRSIPATFYYPAPGRSVLLTASVSVA